jgi:hypothetical protein
MRRIRGFRLILLLAAALFFGTVIADTLGIFHDAPYHEVPHGDHVHYVPKDRDPEVSVSQFPTRPPGPNERITPDGRIVLVE